jgi:hypothetical protein
VVKGNPKDDSALLKPIFGQPAGYSNPGKGLTHVNGMFKHRVVGFVKDFELPK